MIASLGALALAACGFEPLHDPAGPAGDIAGRVAVDLIDGSPGFAMRERLVDRLGAPDAPTHRLAVALRLTRVGVAITERDVTTRFEVRGVATYALFPLESMAPALAGEAVAPALTGEAEAVTGYSAPSSATASAFAVLAAERDAQERLALLLADRIAQRLAVDAGVWR